MNRSDHNVADDCYANVTYADGKHLQTLRTEGAWKVTLNKETRHVFLEHRCITPENPIIRAWEERCFRCDEEVPSGITSVALIAMLSV